MNELLPYLLKSTLCLSLLYLAFRAVMRKETFFALNRTVLLAIIACSILIPLINLPQVILPEIQKELMPAVPVIENQLPEFPEVADPPTVGGSHNITTEKPERAFPIMQLIGYLYFAGMLFSLLVLIHGLITLLLLFRKAEIKMMEGYKLLIIEKDIQAFSFCRMIFISRADYTEHGSTILAHEQQHIRLGHFYDLLLMELAKMVHWFNPIIYWLIQDLKTIHEYQADRNTLTKGIDARKYQLLIIEKGVGHQRLALANSFNHCQIKKRITMMNQSKNGKAWRWKVATFLPLLALLLMAFGKEGENLQKDSPSQKEMLNQEKSIVTEPSTQPKDSIYSTPEIMPQFPGGEEAIRKFIIENIHYPEEKAQMKEYLKEKPLLEKGFVTFSINSKGKVINIKLVKSIKNVLDAEAVKAIPLMPNWIPAKDKGKPVSASYTIPFDFILWPDPQANKGEKIVPPPSPIPTLKIEIRKDGNYIDNRLFSLEEIRKKAEEFQKSNPNGVTSLKMDKDVSQERVNETREILKNVKVMVDDPRASNSQQLSIDGHKSNVAPPPPPPLLKIDIKKDGNYVDGHLLSLEEIRKKAEAYQKSNPNAVVSLKVEKEVPLERVNEVKEVLRQAKIQNINKSSSATSASNMAPSLIIECKSNGIYVDDQLSTLEELRLKAREWKNQNPKGNVGLYESKGAQIPYTKVIDVLFSEKIKSINTTIRSEDEDNLFTYNDVTQKPIFAKGNFDEWIGKEIGKLHDKYNKYNNFGFIYSFIINENGDIKGITVKGMGVDRKDINQEFEAILTQMPAWSPGQHKGQAVKVKYARANGMQYTKDFKPDKEES